MVKIEFKIDIIWVRLIILKSLYYESLCDWYSDDLAIGWWCAHLPYQENGL
jgi:hypothetical protein